MKAHIQSTTESSKTTWDPSKIGAMTTRIAWPKLIVVWSSNLLPALIWIFSIIVQSLIRPFSFWGRVSARWLWVRRIKKISISWLLFCWGLRKKIRNIIMGSPKTSHWRISLIWSTIRLLIRMRRRRNHRINPLKFLQMGCHKTAHWGMRKIRYDLCFKLECTSLRAPWESSNISDKTSLQQSLSYQV